MNHFTERSSSQDELQQHLNQGIEELKAKVGLQVTSAQAQQLLAYLHLLIKWNKVYNLTSVRNPREMVQLHLLDSLAVAHCFKQARNLLDVGSGGGLPGMVLAILYPHAKVSMIDIVHKKTAFLTQVKAQLDLKNVSIYTQQVQSLVVDELFDVITSRAFSELAHFVNWAGHLLAPQGRFLALKSIKLHEEITQLPPEWQVENIEDIHVPSLEVQRYLVQIKRIN